MPLALKDVPLGPKVGTVESTEDKHVQKEEAVVAPPWAATPFEASETGEAMVCVLADGTTIECEAQPFIDDPGQGGEGTLYWTKVGGSVVRIYSGCDAERGTRLRRLIEEHNVIAGEPYWEKLFSWPQGIIKQPSLGCLFSYRPRKAWMLSWLLTRKRRESLANLTEDKPGSWVKNVSYSIKVARIVRRLHEFGLVHPDLSPAIFLFAPPQNSVTLIRCDELSVPGMSPLSLIPWMAYQAPELVTQIYSPAVRAEESRRTNLHSLATIIYHLLLQRHPLIGPKEHSADPALDEALMLGERALFVEHPADSSNRPENLPLPYTSLLTPAVQRLVERAFVEGLHDPERRPTAAEWERDLVRMADALVPCTNPACPLQAFVLPQSTPAHCPACGTSLDNPPLVPVLHFYRPAAGNRGEFRNDDGYVLVGWPGRTLHVSILSAKLGLPLPVVVFVQQDPWLSWHHIRVQLSPSTLCKCRGDKQPTYCSM